MTAADCRTDLPVAAIGTDDGKISIWNLEHMQLITQIDNHDSAGTLIVFYLLLYSVRSSVNILSSQRRLLRNSRLRQQHPRFRRKQAAPLPIRPLSSSHKDRVLRKRGKTHHLISRSRQDNESLFSGTRIWEQKPRQMHARSQEQKDGTCNVAHCRFCIIENERKCLGQSCRSSFKFKYGDDLVHLQNKKVVHPFFHFLLPIF